MSDSRTAELAERAARDPHRPRFHFTPPGGWLNDPNGLGTWHGTYHLFYQHNPDAPVHERMHWGHATSADMVHWTDQPIALAPGDDDSPDADGCWSGVLVDDGGVPTLLYSGHRGDKQRACLATGDPGLRRWRKDPANPVIPEPPDDLDLIGFRDHCVWREDGEWQQLVGAGIRGVGGAALRYTSDDLRTWRYRGPLHVGDGATHEPAPHEPGTHEPAGERDPVWTGTMWECVDFFPLGDMHVLMFSVWHEGRTLYPVYSTGRYRDGRFEPEASRILDYGGRFCYAPQSMRDGDERVLFGWMQEGRSEPDVQAAGWAGALTAPRLLRPDGRGGLHQAPAPQVARLRRQRVTAEDGGELGPGDSVRPEGLRGDRLDFEARLLIDPAARVELTIREVPDGSERTIVTLDRANGTLTLDRERSSLAPGTDAEPLGGPLPIGEDGAVHLRVLIDRSALEIFANGRALSARIYPTRPDATGVRLHSVGGPTHVERLEAWTMGDARARSPMPS